MNKIEFFFLVNIFLYIGCEQTESREPINSYKKSFLNKSANRNIKINEREEMSFIKIIEKDSKSNYTQSKKGFWFKILKSSSQMQKMICFM